MVIKAGGSSSQGSQVILCPGGSGNKYCCGDTNNCCTEGNEFSLEPTLVSFSSDATATTTAVVTTTNSDATSSKTISLGVGLGVPLGIIAIAMLGTGFWWGRRNTRAKYRAFQQDSRILGIRQADSRPITELDSRVGPKGPFELSNSGDAIE